MKSCPYLDKVLVFATLWFVSGCEVTKEKIDIWKQSDKGAAKLRACVRDDGQTMAIRTECAQALAGMGLVYYLGKDLNEISAADKKTITADLAKKLVASMKGSNPKETNNVKLEAKDALFSIRGMLEPKQKDEVDREVVTWILGDFAKRREGDHGAEKIIKTSKSVAGPILAAAIDQGGTPPLAVAVLINKVGSQEDRDAAAKKLVELAKKEKKLSAFTLKALGMVNSAHAIDYLLGMTQRGQMQTRTFALRALQIEPNVRTLAVAKAIAADDTLKGKEEKLIVREEAFNLLALIKDPKALDILLGFLEHADKDIRYTAMHRIIVGFKVKGLPKLLERLSISYTYERSDLADLVVSYITDLSAKALPPIRTGLNSKNWMAKLVCIQVLAKIGTKKDLVALEKLVNDTTKIKGWDKATIGSEAKAAAKMIRSRKK